MTYTYSNTEKTFEIDGQSVTVEICREREKDQPIAMWVVYFTDQYGTYGSLMTRKNRPRPSEIKKALEKYY